MADKRWNRMILDQIKDQIQSPQVVTELVEVLQLSPDSVYRRIRGDTPFTLRDLIKMGQCYRFSVDRLIGDHGPWPALSKQPAWEVITFSELENVWSTRSHAQWIIRDLPLELLDGLPYLEYYLKPYLPAFPALGLLHRKRKNKTRKIPHEEFLFSTQLVDALLCRLRHLRRQGRIEHAIWTTYLDRELAQLLDRIEHILLRHRSSPLTSHYFSPDPMLSNMVYIAHPQSEQVCLIHDSGLILRAFSGPLYRWVILQIELRKWSAIPQRRLQRPAVDKLMTNWRQDCRHMGR